MLIPDCATPRKDLEALYLKANTGFAKFNPFTRKERFIVHFNYALATGNQALLNSLSKKDKTLFKTLCQEEISELSIEEKPVQNQQIRSHAAESKENSKEKERQDYLLMYRHLGIPQPKELKIASLTPRDSFSQNENAAQTERQPLLQDEPVSSNIMRHRCQVSPTVRFYLDVGWGYLTLTIQPIDLMRISISFNWPTRVFLIIP